MIITKTIISIRLIVFILTLVFSCGYKLYGLATTDNVKGVLRELTGISCPSSECYKLERKVDVLGGRAQNMPKFPRKRYT